MSEMIGYMLTWTTYGSWVQGDKKGYVKDREIFGQNDGLEERNLNNMNQSKVKLTEAAKKIVRKAIIRESKKLGQQIYALAVCSNHVHLVAEYIADPISEVAGYYKNAARVVLYSNGFSGKVWTKGFDKRYCFDEVALNSRIEYVNRHKV